MNMMVGFRPFALIASLVLALLASLPAQAQNVICSTAPLGDNSNRCASTAYVQANLLSLALASGKIFIGSVSNVPTPQTVSGDGALSIAGVFTLTTVNGNVGSWGSATQCPSFTVNAKGLITAASQANCTPAIGDVTGLGTNVATALATNVGSAGAFVVNGGALGTPSSGVGTNLTGTAAGLTAGHVTTNANLTGDVTSIGNATTLAPVNANVGSFGSATQCTAFTTNAKGLITAASQTTCTPALASITGLGTNVATALAANVNASGGIVSPTPTRAGDVIYWNGSAWVTLAGNNSGTQVFQENASGVPSWGTVSGTGTVTSVVCGTGLSGGTITTSGSCAVSLTSIANSLGADVALNNTANYFDGPSVAQGTSGTWYASGSVAVNNVSGGDNINCKLWDGTNVISSSNNGGGSYPANTRVNIALSGALATPAGNIRISCRDPNNTTAIMVFNTSGNSKDSTLTAIRIQ